MHNLLNDELQITPDIKALLHESARWGRFLSIVGLILSGMVVVMAFLLPSLIDTLSAIQHTEMLPEGSKTGITINFLIIASVIFFPSIFLLKFSKAMKKALEEINQDDFSIAFSNLKTLLKFYGVITIIILGLYALAIILYLIASSLSR